eukprot:gene5110-8708_t
MKKKNNDEIEILSYLWVLLKLGFPILITRIATATMAFTDNIFLGHLGSNELAASSLGNTIVTCSFYTVLGLTTALETLMSQAYGAKNYEMIGVLLQRCVIIQSLFFVPVTFLLSFTEPILIFFQQDVHISHLTGVYVHVMSIGWYPLILTRVLIQYLNSQTSMLPSMFVVILSNFLNIIFNFILVKGTFIPYFNGFGFIGSPIATTLSRTFQLFLIVSIILIMGLHKKTWKGLNISKALDWKECKEFMSIGIPGSLMNCLEVWGFSVYAIPASYIGHKYLAAHSVILNVSYISFMFPLSLSSSAGIRIGNLIGSGNAIAAKISSYIVILVGFVITIFISTIFLTFRNLIPRIYTEDVEVVKITSDVLVVCAGFNLFDGVQGVSSGILKGIGKQKIGLILNLLAYYFIGLPFGLLFSYAFGLKLIGLWSGLLVGLFSNSSLMLLYILFKINWENEVELAANRLSKKTSNEKSKQNIKMDALEISHTVVIVDNENGREIENTD